MEAVVERFFAGLKAASQGPYAVVAYIVAGLVALYYIREKYRVQNVATLAKDKSEENRRLTIKTIFSELPKDGLTSDEYLRKHMRGVVTLVVVLLLICATVVVVSAIEHQPPPAVVAPTDPPANLATRSGKDWDDDPNYGPLRDRPMNAVQEKTVGDVELVQQKQEVIQDGASKFTLVKVIMRNKGDKPLVLPKIVVHPISPIMEGVRTPTTILTPVSRIYVPLSNIPMRRDTAFDLQDSIEIGAGATLPLELVFCHRYVEKGREKEPVNEDEVPARRLQRSNKELFVTSMNYAILAYVKFPFEGNNTVVSERLEIR
jgi:hypothetical protein